MVRGFRGDAGGEKNIPPEFLCPNHSDKPLRAKIVSAKASTIFDVLSPLDKHGIWWDIFSPPADFL